MPWTTTGKLYRSWYRPDLCIWHKINISTWNVWQRDRLAKWIFASGPLSKLKRFCLFSSVNFLILSSSFTLPTFPSFSRLQSVLFRVCHLVLICDRDIQWHAQKLVTIENSTHAHLVIIWSNAGAANETWSIQWWNMFRWQHTIDTNWLAFIIAFYASVVHWFRVLIFTIFSYMLFTLTEKSFRWFKISLRQRCVSVIMNA